MRHLILLLLLAITGQVYTQNIFEDAKLIRSYYDERSRSIKLLNQAGTEGVLNRLAYYAQYDTSGMVMDNDIFRKLCEDNPFFTTNNELFGEKIGFSSQFQNAMVANLAATEAAAPAASSSPFGVTKIADGFAKFLVTRTKQELSVAFFSRFNRKLEQQEELRMLFPSTYETLQAAEDEIYLYQRYLESLRYSFISDLDLMPTQLQYFLERTPLINNQVAQYTVLDVLQLTQYLLNEKTEEQTQQRDFWDYLNYLSDSSFIHRQALTANTANGLKIINGNVNLSRLVAKSLWNQTDGTWEKPADLFRGLSDPITLKIYLGLLYPQTKSFYVDKITNDSLLTFGKLLENSSGDLSKLLILKSEIQRFVENAQQFNASLKALETRPDSVDNTYPLLYPMLESMFNMFEVGFNLSDVNTSSTGEDDPDLQAPQAFFRLLRQLNEFNLHISQKRYAASITNMLSVLQEISDLRGGENDQLVKEVFRYGYFVAAVAEAQNADQVSNAIELFALPQGSGNQKKYSNFSITLQAYSGLTYGREYLVDLEDEDGGYVDSLERGIMAVSAPIGLAFNYGMRKAGSLSLYASAVDIGALTAFRFNDPTSEDLPAFEWENIIAPGLYLVYGLPWDLPISFGAGFQSGPQLRRVDGNFAIEQSKARRFGVFLSVDIPIAQFYGQ